MSWKRTDDTRLAELASAPSWLAKRWRDDAAELWAKRMPTAS